MYPLYNTPEDDGSLACLNIPADRNRKRFACPEEKQSNLVGKTFWVIDYYDNVPSKYAQDRYLFKIKENLEDGEDKARKVWTGSEDIKFILDKLRELDKFPRRVTLRRGDKNNFYFE